MLLHLFVCFTCIFQQEVQSDTDVYIKTSWTYNCVSCNGICRNCYSGWYGTNCTLRCENCSVDGCSKTTGICYVCAAGYYGYQCKDTCPENCYSNCDRGTNECTDGCKTGWWGDHCHERCSKGCLKGVCTYDGKKCLRGCIDGYQGERCLQCTRNFYGDNCTQRCSDGCIGGICSRDGSCQCRNGYTGSDCSLNLPATKQISCYHPKTCNPGYYGDCCSHPCINCSGDGCERSTGRCYQCKEGYFGGNCAHLCSKNCKSKHNNHYCHRKTGKCLDGCRKGWFGDECLKSCEHCVKQICDSNGTCLEVYTEGHYGNTFSGDYLTKTEFVIFFCILVFTVTVSVGVYFFCRRKSKVIKAESQSLRNDAGCDHYDEINDSDLDNLDTNTRESIHRSPSSITSQPFVERSNDVDNRDLSHLNENLVVHISPSSVYLHACVEQYPRCFVEEIFRDRPLGEWLA